MSVFDFLFDLFQDEEARTELAADGPGYIEEHLPEGMTQAEFLEGVESVCGELPPEQAAILRSAYGLDGPDGTSPSSPSYPPAPPQQPGETDIDYTLRQINHYSEVVNVTNQSFEDNDTTTINDQDTNVDNSVNQNITAFGDVTQDFDNDVVTGDENALGGDGAQVNSGDGAVQAGGNITDATIATGNVEGSVTGDVYDSVVGDDNQVIDDSTVGAVSFGEGDAINADNVNQGDGTIVDDAYGDVNVNAGDGDQTVVSDSTLSESAVGGSTVQSNDVDITADDGSSVAFGDGSSAEASDVDVYNESGTVQVADDGATQTAATDNSINDSYDTEGSFNTTDNSLDASINDSYDPTSVYEDNDTTTTTTEDNDTTTTTVDDEDLIDL